jgi:hypothetical protein
MNLTEAIELLSKLNKQVRQEKLELVRMVVSSPKQLALNRTNLEITNVKELIKKIQCSYFSNVFEVRKIVQLGINNRVILRHVVVPKRAPYLYYIQRVEFPWDNKVYWKGDRGLQINDPLVLGCSVLFYDYIEQGRNDKQVNWKTGLNEWCNMPLAEQEKLIEQINNLEGEV